MKLIFISGVMFWVFLHLIDNNAYARSECESRTNAVATYSWVVDAVNDPSILMESIRYACEKVRNDDGSTSIYNYYTENTCVGNSVALGFNGNGEPTSCGCSGDDIFTEGSPDAFPGTCEPPVSSSCPDNESLMGTVCCPAGTSPSSLGDGNGAYGSTNSCSCPDLPADQQTGICGDGTPVPDLPTDCETELELAVIACGADQIQTFECESTLENGGDSNASVAYVCGDPPDNADGCPSGTTYGSFNENYACYPNGDTSGSEPDLDGDGIPDSSDDDIDGDGIPNGSDDTPSGAGSGTDDGGTDGGTTDDTGGDPVDLSGIEGQLSSINGTLSGMSGTLGGIKSDTAGIRSNTANTTNAVNALGGKIDSTNAALTDLANGQASDSIKLDEISQGIAASGVFADLTNQGIGDINETLSGQSGQLGDINSGLGTLGDSITEGNGRLADLNDGLSTLNDAILASDDDTQIAIENFSDDVAAASADTNESLDALEDKADESNGLLDDILSKLGQVFDSSEALNAKQQETTDAIGDSNTALSGIDSKLDANGAANAQGLSDVEGAVDSVGSGINSLNSKAGEILDKMPTGLTSTEEDSEEFISGAKARLDAAYTRMSSAPIVAAGGDVFGSLPSGNDSCPVFSVGVFGETVSTSLHCDIFDSVKPAISAVFLAFWSIVAVMVFRRA